jgi:DNA-binding transcriptional LysR family regulator
MIDSIDLRRLHVLRLVHRYGTVTAAAEALRLTPSAVSHQIRQLARETGTPLLEPDGRRVRLTQAGHTLVAHADLLHAGWERARADLAAQGAGTTGVLRLCGFPTAVAGLLAPAAQRLSDTAPRLSVEITEVEVAEGFDLVLAGDVDIAIVVPTPDGPPLDDAKYDQQPLLEDPLDLLVPAAHPLADRTGVTLNDAAEQPWIVPAPGIDFHSLVLAACAAAGFTPKITHHVKDGVAISALVSRGLGLAIVPRLAPLPAHHGVVRIPLPGKPPPTRQLLTCTRRGSQDHPAIARGLAALRDVSRDLPPSLVPTRTAYDEDHELQSAPHRHGRISDPPSTT